MLCKKEYLQKKYQMNCPDATNVIHLPESARQMPGKIIVHFIIQPFYLVTYCKKVYIFKTPLINFNDLIEAVSLQSCLLEYCLSTVKLYIPFIIESTDKIGVSFNFGHL